MTTAFLHTAVLTNTYKSTAQAEGQELINNGGFEIDPLADINDPNILNSNVTGWVKSGDPTAASGVTISNFPHTGNQGLSLGAFSSIAYISQTISTVPGQHYQLTYYLASIEEAPNLDNKLHVFVNGEKVSSKKNIGYQAYTEYKLDFEAEGTSTEIKFGSLAKYAFLYLDDVSVKAAPEDEGQQ
nr:DUF642 domain-containing protein [Nostoc sp. UIC 10630]